MAVEKTLAIVKPDAMDHLDEIVDILYDNGLNVEKMHIRHLNDEILAEHYAHLLDKEFYPTLRNYMLSSEVAIMILKGDNAVSKLRELMGPTDSKLANKNTIRGMFGTNITYNAIHGSDSIESANSEIKRFFKK